MKGLACWTLLAVLPVGVAWGAPEKPKAAPPPPAPSVVQVSLKDLERNVALGAALTRREGSADEFAVVQKLADRGLETARRLVAKDPNSAEAQHLLGSWLLRGYRVTPQERVTVDAFQEEHRERVKTSVRGLEETPQAGLEALAAARTLAPKNFAYLTDYVSALLECDQPSEAMTALKRVWADDLTLTPAQQLQVGLLMSDAHLARGELAEARAWLYRALSAQSQNLALVSRLRNLDTLAAEAAKAAAEAPAAEAAPPASPEEGATSEAAPEEPAPAAEEGSTDEAAPATGDEEQAEPPAAEVGD